MTQVSKEIGLIGLGNMGTNIAKMLQGSGYSLVLYDRTAGRYPVFEGKEQVYASKSMQDFANKLKQSAGSSIVWMMVPPGDATNGIASELSKILRKNDIVIDASNSLYTDSIANYNRFKASGISYLDVGCAGGPEDLLHGVSLMVGGDRQAFDIAEDIFRVVSGKGTYGYIGGTGSGHMAKLVHNGIFYGIFPVYSEGMELLMKFRDEQQGAGFDMKEALRLLSSCPPITTGIMRAVSAAINEGQLPDAAQIKISEMVEWEIKQAKNKGVSLSITNMILSGYPTISDTSRRIYARAKRLLTGH